MVEPAVGHVSAASGLFAHSVVTLPQPVMQRDGGGGDGGGEGLGGGNGGGLGGGEGGGGGRAGGVGDHGRGEGGSLHSTAQGQVSVRRVQVRHAAQQNHMYLVGLQIIRRGVLRRRAGTDDRGCA